MANNLAGGAGDDWLEGANGNDLLDGGDGSDSLDGGLGNDLLVGGTGTNSFFGDVGVDTASYAGAMGAMTVNLLTGMANGSDAGAQGARSSDIESVIGSAYSDTLKARCCQHPDRR